MRVKLVKPSVIKGYYGMNHEAGKHLGVSCPKGTILVANNVKGRMFTRTVQHEKVEEYLMREKGLSYNKAHNVAMKFENPKKRKK